MATQVENTQLEFARFAGPGTRMYRSPKPGEVDDLVLPALKWVQVDPLYSRSGTYVRDRNKKLFEIQMAEAIPDDLDLDIPEDLDSKLSTVQREMARQIALTPSEELKPEFRSALAVAELMPETGIPSSNAHEKFTVSYLRETHRPFLMAVAELEKRYQKRKTVLALIRKQLDHIGRLPAG